MSVYIKEQKGKLKKIFLFDREINFWVENLSFRLKIKLRKASDFQTEKIAKRILKMTEDEPEMVSLVEDDQQPKESDNYLN